MCLFVPGVAAAVMAESRDRRPGTIFGVGFLLPLLVTVGVVCGGATIYAQQFRKSYFML